MKRIVEYLLVVCTVLAPLPAWAGPALDCEGSAKAYALQGIPCTCVNGQIVCDQPSGKHKSKHGSTSGSVKAMFVGALFEGMLTSLFDTGTQSAKSQEEALAAQQKAAALAAQQAAAFQRAQEAAFQAQHNRMMQSFKQLDGSQGGGVAFKGLSDSTLAFKTLDSDAETLAVDARKPFDTVGRVSAPAKTPGQATPFFGDTMPLKDIQFLANPENDPRVVDLRNASAYLVQNLKKEEAKAETGTKPPAEKKNAKPVASTQECAKLAPKMQGYLNQREKFHKTVDLAQEQLTTWQEANRNALLNAAKEGIEYFTGQLLERMDKRGAAAERLQGIYKRNAARMAQDGLDVTAIQAKIERLRMYSSVGKIAELTGNIKDWQTFLKDGMSALMAQLTSSNQEIQGMLDDPQMQKYFETESPELKALLDISRIGAANKVFGKWVAKKVPLIAGVELSLNQSYNALDWLLSFQRMSEANRINGKVLAAAKSLQHQIDATSMALQDCRP